MREEPAPRPSALAIYQYEDDDERVYLMRCDAEWRTIADTLHASFNEAVRQAAFEFESLPARWPLLPE